MSFIQSPIDFELINKYDENGNLVVHTTSDGTRKEYRYDTKSNLIYYNSVKDNIEEIKEYDDKNRLIKSVNSDGTVTTKSYYVDDNWIINNVRPYKDDTFISQLAGHNILIHSCFDIIRAGDYSIFKLSKKMTDRIMPEVITDKNIIGIHIRRTDNLKSIKYSPTNLFIDKMKEELSNNSDAKFYLATDDPNEEKELKDRFKTHILIYTKTSLNRNDPNAIYDAVIDLYHLSQCKKLYASYWSSFSDIAALWGNINKYVLAKDIE